MAGVDVRVDGGSSTIIRDFSSRMINKVGYKNAIFNRAY